MCLLKQQESITSSLLVSFSEAVEVFEIITNLRIFFLKFKDMNDFSDN